jgi:hypothetical protein
LIAIKLRPAAASAAVASEAVATEYVLINILFLSLSIQLLFLQSKPIDLMAC